VVFFRIKCKITAVKNLFWKQYITAVQCIAAILRSDQWMLLRGGRGGPFSSVNFIKNYNCKTFEKLSFLDKTINIITSNN
jgi:hypothetical protein